MEIPEWLDRYKIQLGLGVVGVFLLMLGWWQNQNSGSEVIVLEPEEDEVVQVEGEGEVDAVVEVAGAVNNPGVYRLDNDARVALALAAAGGLHEAADRLWVARNINQAAMVEDGMKVYVPAVEEIQSMQGMQDQNPLLASPLERGRDGSVAGARVMNVNTVTQSELESLWGIGEARAMAIMEQRPFGSLEEMAQKAGIPKNVMERNEGKWEAK